MKFYRSAASGREQILGILAAGDTCACNPGKRCWQCSSTAEAVTPCKVWYLSLTDYVERVKKNNRLSQSLNKVLAERLQMLSSLLEQISLKGVKERLVQFLLDMLRRQNRSAHKAGKVLFIPFTREEIAQRLGTARETIARYLTQLKDQGLIDIKPYQIIILDREGLEKLI